jgi:hypothetical protein
MIKQSHKIKFGNYTKNEMPFDQFVLSVLSSAVSIHTAAAGR